MSDRKHDPSIDDLQPDPKNANKGSDRGRALVEASLQECGAGRSILVDRDGTTIAGAKTLEAAQKLGLPVKIVETAGDELVVVRRGDLDLASDARARRLAFYDNRSSELGLEWDCEQLLADIQGGVDLTGIFERPELDALLAAVLQREGLCDPDSVPEVPEEPTASSASYAAMRPARPTCGACSTVANPDSWLPTRRTACSWICAGATRFTTSSARPPAPT